MPDRARGAVERSFVRRRKGNPPFEENEAAGGRRSNARRRQTCSVRALKTRVIERSFERRVGGCASGQKLYVTLVDAKLSVSVFGPLGYCET
jgi:hypothetical protein